MIKHLGIQSTCTTAYQRLSRVQIQSILTSLLCGSSQEAEFQASPNKAGSGRLHNAGSGRLHNAFSHPRCPTRPSPHSMFYIMGQGWWGGSCLHTPVSDPSTSPKASLKQHMFYHPACVQTPSEILGCAIPLTEVTWAPVRTENAKTGK